MFDNVYNNGETTLGKVQNIIDYVKYDSGLDEITMNIYLEPLEEIKKEDKDAIVMIGYDHPNFIIKHWTYNDIVNKP